MPNFYSLNPKNTAFIMIKPTQEEPLVDCKEGDSHERCWQFELLSFYTNLNTVQCVLAQKVSQKEVIY